MSQRFNDTTVLITGGARGMGAEHARGFHAEGASVVVADILDDDGQALAGELGDRARYVSLDVTEPDQWEAAVATAEDAYGPVGVLVNNAGIGGPPTTVADTDPDEWRKVMAVNLDGVFYGIRAVVPSMRKAGGGSIVNISSFAGLEGTPLSNAYSASKFAVRGLTKTAAFELGRENIRVNSVHPGYIETPILGGLSPEDAGLDLKLALPRMAQPEEVTKLVLFVASTDASYSTGSEFVIDGGWSAGDPFPIAANETFVPSE